MTAIFTANGNWQEMYGEMKRVMLHRGQTIDTGVWQSTPDTRFSKSVELQFVTVIGLVPETADELVLQVKPNLPWAEDHFQERVSGIPYNPPPSAAYWPFTQAGHKEHTKDGMFSHTYPERMAGFLDDVVSELKLHPFTRQAYLPIWHSVDTTRLGIERVPCTIGYHLMLRPAGKELRLHLHYYMRSCDLLRYFPDDYYMAARLMQWVCEKISSPQLKARPGDLHMAISSLHVFEGDLPMLRWVAAV